MDDRRQVVRRALAAMAGIAVVTATYFTALRVNPTTVALTYVLVILLTATRWGIVESTVAAVTAVACFNYFFLPPVLTWTIGDPENWVALIVFMLTAVIASQLSGRLRHREIEAVNRQRDLERLYALSRALLLSDHTGALPVAIARRIAQTFDVEAVALYDRTTDTTAFAGRGDVPGIDAHLRSVTLEDDVGAPAPAHVSVILLRLGGAPIGALAIAGSGLNETVLQSIANLAAIAIERAKGVAAATRAEAARQNAELRATVLDAVAHEFKTPLTTMKAATDGLLARVGTASSDRELVEIMDEELERLGELVTDAVQMLRIDAGDFVVNRHRYRLADIVAVARRGLGPRLDGHAVADRVPPDLLVEADRGLLALAIRQILDNALKYSPPAATIELSAATNGSVRISIRNSGSYLSEREQQQIFDRFFRGSQAARVPGTGMGLAIVRQIVEAHGGTVAVSSAPDVGTEFTMTLPHGGTEA